MKLTLTILLLLAATSFAIQLRKVPSAENTHPLERLKSLAKNSPEMQFLASAIQLSLKTGGGKVDEVIKLIENALAIKRNELSNLKESSEREKGRLANIIGSAKQQVQKLVDQIIPLANEIDGLKKDIENFNSCYERKKAEAEAQRTRKQALTDARHGDEDAYATRTKRDNSAVEALDEIIPALERLAVQGASFLEKSKEDLEQALAQIPNNNPIQALVQLSTTLDAENLRVVIEKLKNIREAIIASRQDDQNAENEAKARFQTMLANVEGLISAAAVESSTCLSQRENKSQQYNSDVSLSNNLKSQVKELEQTITDTSAQLDAATLSFANQIKNGEGAVAALGQALNIVKEGANELEPKN